MGNMPLEGKKHTENHKKILSPKGSTQWKEKKIEKKEQTK